MIIADTGFWVALANRGDRHHELAEKRLSELESSTSGRRGACQACKLLILEEL
jgi:predicted nucleic acid-binding protein